MSVDDSCGLLKRERDSLLARTGAGPLLVALGPFLEHLSSDAAIREVLTDLRLEATRIRATIEEHTAAVAARLNALRARIPYDVALDDPLPEVAPGGPRPAPSPETEAASAARWRNECRQDFDQTAAAYAQAADYSNREIPKKMIGWLGARIDGIDAAARSPFTTEIASLREGFARASRTHAIDLRTKAGFALRRLELAVGQLNPAPLASMFDKYDRTLGDPSLMRDLVHGTSEYTPVLGKQELRVSDEREIETNLRTCVSTVCEEVERRLSGRRSREGVLRAYKLRCEWYDVTGLTKLVRGLRSVRGKEDALVDHLALYLFDAGGMRPLTRANVGRLIPDLLDELQGGSFYVEAKQYGTVAGAQKAIRDGSRQIWSTAERLRGRYVLREAFLVVFRIGGPLLQFEEAAVTRDELTLRAFLIDLAPGKVSGSRQKAIVEVPRARLLAAATPVPTKKRVRTRKTMSRDGWRR